MLNVIDMYKDQNTASNTKNTSDVKNNIICFSSNKNKKSTDSDREKAIKAIKERVEKLNW